MNNNQRALAHQLMLAFRRENGRKALADLLARNNLPSSFANSNWPEHAAAIISVVSAKLSPAAVAEARRLADTGAGEADQWMEGGEAATNAPKSFAELDPDAIYRKWNAAGRGRD